MNRFKVNIAKEKILRLREKYSKNQEEINSSSESLISIKSEKNGEQEKLFQHQTVIIDNPAQQNPGDNISCDRLEKELFEEVSVKEKHLKADLELSDKITQESKFDIVEKTFEKPLSPGSLVLSDLSNQFECIRFISSSSEDLSIVESENTQTKSISDIVISSVKISEVNKNCSNEELEIYKDNFKTIDTSERDSSLETLSSSESNDSTKISSIEELLNSESDTGNKNEQESIANKTRILDSAQDSNNDARFTEKVDLVGSPLQQNEIGELSSSVSLTSILQKDSSVNAVVSKVREISSDSNAESHYSKKYKSESKTHVEHKGETERRDVSLDNIPLTKTSLKALEVEIKTSKYTKYDKYVNQSTNTDPVKVSLPKNRSKHHHCISVTRLNRPKSKMEKYKNINISEDKDFCMKESTKRPFIQPCNLINKDEIRNIEAKSEVHQNLQPSTYNLTGDFYNFPTSVATCDISCDAVITLLLKKQIQLTRHFIESHQRMYLQVCQAAQLLNENHSATQ